MAMAEATKLFDGAGGATSGNKQDAVNSAAMTVMKLLVQSKFSGATGGGNSGGIGGLLSMVCRFLLIRGDFSVVDRSSGVIGKQVYVDVQRRDGLQGSMYSKAKMIDSQQLYSTSAANAIRFACVIFVGGISCQYIPSRSTECILPTAM